MITLLSAFTAAKALPWRLIGILLAIAGLLFAGWHIEHQATLVAQLTADRDRAVRVANANADAMKALVARHEEIITSAEQQMAAEKNRQADLQSTIESLKNAPAQTDCRPDSAARSALQRLR